MNPKPLFLSHHGDNGFYLPYSHKSELSPALRTMSRRGPFDKWLLKKYTSPPCQILPTDTVVDCGAFVGAFSVAAFKQGVKRIFSIEPSPHSLNCLNLNIAHYQATQQITALQIALGKEQGLLSLNLSRHPCENSFLPCDKGGTGEVVPTQVRTCDWLIQQKEIDADNLYLKVEAEGFETEIIEGLTSFKPRVITIDVTPERNGRSPRKEIGSLLKSRGYSLFNTQRCLFAY